mgnify:CR=1 FL=1
MSIADTSAAAPPVIDQEEAQRARRERIYRIARWMLPTLVMVVAILAWHLYVTIGEVPHYILPGPVLVWNQMLEDWGLLWSAMMITTIMVFSGQPDFERLVQPKVFGFAAGG